MDFSTCTLRAARDELGITQQEMAEKLGVSRNYVCMIETGEKPFSSKLRKKLVEIAAQKVNISANQSDEIREANANKSTLYDKSEHCPHCAILREEVLWLRETLKRQ